VLEELPLSPILFNLAVEKLVNDMGEQTMIYADDLCLMTGTNEKLLDTLQNGQVSNSK